VERVLADIDANHGDGCVEFLRHGVLLVLVAPCQHYSLAGQEHGRTIPLSDIAKMSAPQHNPFSPSHSITSSARSKNASGIMRPSA
jgi:hypothetical protein